MAWPTGETILNAQVAVHFLVPANDWITQTLVGACNYLQYNNSWDKVGDATPDQISTIFRAVLRNVRVEAVSVGQVVTFAADNMQYVNQDPAQGPSQWLKCEGQDLSVVAYSALYSVIGNTWGGDVTHFYLPDLRSRVLAGAGTGGGLSAYSLGEVFGEEAHTLTSLEMPSHSHTYNPPGVTIPALTGEEPVSSPFELPASTGSAGGGGSHENRQPSMALFFYMQVFP